MASRDLLEEAPISKSGTSVLPPILARRISPELAILYNVAREIES